MLGDHWEIGKYCKIILGLLESINFALSAIFTYLMIILGDVSYIISN